MKLMFAERMVILGILPETGSFMTLKLIRKLREDLAPDEEEIERMNIRENPETRQVTWDPSKDDGLDIEIGEIAFEMIRKSLLDLDKQEKLTSNHESIYEKFIV